MVMMTSAVAGVASAAGISYAVGAHAGLGVFFAVLMVVLGLGLLTYELWKPSRAELRRVIEGRERVREAEEGLERALRPAPGGSHMSAEPGPYADGLRSGSARDGADLAGTRLTLPELWAVTHRRLDLYHEIALGQAARSFRNAQFAMVLGFVLLAAFVAVALRAGTTAGSVVAGGLGAVAAGLAGYVSRTFIRSQEAAAGHLRAYFHQPLEFSRYLAAERLVADAPLSEERRAEVLGALVAAMVSGPGRDTAENAGGSQDPGGT
ncbi:hypothetical protein [Streptomyces griseochromogenes]|uniref:hypothetical protein n=1 Tax=Streptomyces griseochromogenes TaxID=68214 RepID=UPI0037B0C6B4